MSVTLATMADALIEFILSLLRDPAAAAEFAEDPQASLESRGFSSMNASDVCAVAPIIAERIEVAPAPTAVGGRSVTPDPPSNPVVREIQNIVNNLSWVDDRDTVVDQSVNQNIWADGDVTQVFDQEAVVSSGDDSMAAGRDIDIDQTQDNSTTIDAEGDVNVGNDTEVTVVEDSYNEQTDASTTTDASTDVVVDDSMNDGSTTATTEDSYNSTTTAYTETVVESDTDAVFDSTDTTISDAPTDDNF